MYSSVLTVLSSLSNSCTSIILIKATINKHGHWRDVSSRNNHYVYTLACSSPDVPCLGPPPPTLHNHNQSPVTIPLSSLRSIIIISNVTPGHSHPVSVNLCHDWSQHNQLQITVRGPVRGSERQLSSSFSQATTADIWLIPGDGWLITEQVTVLPCRPSSQHYSPQSHQSATSVNSYHQ